MYTPEQLNEYMSEIRVQVCGRCIDRPPGGPPCAPLGKQCGIELHLTEIVELAHRTRSHAIDPYIERFHSDVCAHCANRESRHCPCPLDPLLLLAIEAIETVDERHEEANRANAIASDDWEPLIAQA
jgi:hypothetical protein